MATYDLDTNALVKLVDSLLDGQFHLPPDSKPFVGGECFVYMLVDEAQGQRISVRIPKALPGDFTTWLLEVEADIRRRIDRAQLRQFQPLLACDPSSDNLIGRPFIVLGWADGSALTWSEHVPESEMKRQGVLRAIANTNLDLLQIQQRGATALDWITGKIDRKIARAMANAFPHGTVSECEKQKSLIQNYWIPEIDDAPHVLVHGDLSGNNIIVNEDLEVTSVIDLGWAQMIPLQFAAEYPRFISHEPVMSDSGYSWLHNGNVQLHKDRLYYLACIRERAEREGGLAMWYCRILSREDEINRHWWYTAASRADVHKAMAAYDWDPTSVIEQERMNVT